MNNEQFASIVRQILLAAGGFAVSKGWTDNETMVQIVGGLSIVIAGAWALWSRRDKAIVASAAAKVDVPAASQREAGIKQVITPK